jgi:hypothetical protein
VLVRLLTAALATLALAAPAEAARNVPRGFYGVSYDGEVRNASADVQARAWRQMAANGVESARAVFSWADAQPDEGGAFDFSATDRVVEDAAEHAVELVPIVMETPIWARKRITHWYPRRTATFAAYLDALVARYGPGGSFWTEHAEVPERPLRSWQIYNEPGRSKRYGPLLRTAYAVVKDADPGADVVLAGLTGTEAGAPWDILRYQYRRGGIAGYFDVAALHLYTGKAENVAEGVRLFRKVMKRRGDGRMPIWLTEFGITASKGRTTAPRSQRTLRTTDAGMADFLEDAYRDLARDDRRLGLTRAYWYTWASSYEEGAGIFRFAGLNRFADGRFEAKPALASYRRSARRDQGG